MDFVCPKCGGALLLRENSYVCPSAHSYDLARAGYVNLLPPSGSSGHGDNKEMIAARREFLDTGHYLPLATRVCELAAEYVEKNAAVIDIGCGEGYYTDMLERKLRTRDGDSRVSAFDISKDAVKHVRARNKNITLAVASAYSIPARDSAFSAAVNMFSPLAREEILRILGDGGIFIMVFPAEEHLFGLKAAIYDEPYKNAPEELALPGFELLKSERLSYEITLNGAREIGSLFMMTPYAYRTKKENRERVFALEELKTAVDFYICIYRKLEGRGYG